jgi:hypothetical protein
MNFTRSNPSLNSPYNIIEELLKIKLSSKKPCIIVDSKSKKITAISHEDYQQIKKTVDQFKLCTMIIEKLEAISTPLKSFKSIQMANESISHSNSNESLIKTTPIKKNGNLSEDLFTKYLDDIDKETSKKRVKQKADLVLAVAQPIILVLSKGKTSDEKFYRKQLANAIEFHRDECILPCSLKTISLPFLSSSISYRKLPDMEISIQTAIKKLSLKGLDALLGIWLQKMNPSFDFTINNVTSSDIQELLNKVDGEDKAIISENKLYNPTAMAMIIQECVVKKLSNLTYEAIANDISRLLPYVTVSDNQKKILFSYEGSESKGSKLFKCDVTNFTLLVKTIVQLIPQTAYKKDLILNELKIAVDRVKKNISGFQEACANFLNFLDSSLLGKKLYHILRAISQHIYTIPFLNLKQLMPLGINENKDVSPSLAFHFTEYNLKLTCKRTASFPPKPDIKVDIKVYLINEILWNLDDTFFFNSEISVKIHPSNNILAKTFLVRPLKYFNFTVEKIDDGKGKKINNMVKIDEEC